MLTATRENLDRIQAREPTANKRKAMREGRPYIPPCDHPGCGRRATRTRGSRPRTKYLCSEHLYHADYARLRSVGFNPRFIFVREPKTT